MESTKVDESGGYTYYLVFILLTVITLAVLWPTKKQPVKVPTLNKPEEVLKAAEAAKPKVQYPKLREELQQLKLKKDLANNLELADFLKVRNLLYKHAHTKFAEEKN